MTASDRSLSPAAAARSLGVSVKALRLWEAHGLVAPGRTGAGWRAYGPSDLERAREVAALRGLGLSLGAVKRALGGDSSALGEALAAHETLLEARLGETSGLLARIRTLRTGLARGGRLEPGALAALTRTSAAPAVELVLPWPWDGEVLTLPPLPPLAWITGPLGSGKTRLAEALAKALPGGAFLPLDRAPPRAADAAASQRVEAALRWIEEEGGRKSDALAALLIAIEGAGTGPLVVDLVEEGLDASAQEALAAWLRRRPPGARPLVLMTRSSAMLDLAAAGPGEAVLYCPANHGSPMLVVPVPGAAGYEAVESCLATPAARERTRGLTAVRSGQR